VSIRMLSRSALQVSAGLLVGCSAQPPAPADRVLTGQVATYGGPVGAHNGAVVAQPVGLVDASHKVIASTKTDAHGRFSLTAPPGTYSVTGDVCAQAVHVVTLQSSTVQTLDLVCQMD
jgi:hypothetical protein